MSTRNVTLSTSETSQFDIGAQFIGPPESAAFSQQVSEWRAKGLVAPWLGRAGKRVVGTHTHAHIHTHTHTHTHDPMSF